MIMIAPILQVRTMGGLLATLVRYIKKNIVNVQKYRPDQFWPGPVFS